MNSLRTQNVVPEIASYTSPWGPSMKYAVCKPNAILSQNLLNRNKIAQSQGSVIFPTGVEEHVSRPLIAAEFSCPSSGKVDSASCEPWFSKVRNGILTHNPGCALLASMRKCLLR
jgi:hypothetical protein